MPRAEQARGAANRVEVHDLLREPLVSALKGLAHFRVAQGDAADLLVFGLHVAAASRVRRRIREKKCAGEGDGEVGKRTRKGHGRRVFRARLAACHGRFPLLFPSPSASFELLPKGGELFPQRGEFGPRLGPQQRIEIRQRLGERFFHLVET